MSFLWIYERFCIVAMFNPFVPNAPFLYPLRTLKNLKVFCCFQGVEKGALGTNGLRAPLGNNISQFLFRQKQPLEVSGVLKNLRSSHRSCSVFLIRLQAQASNFIKKRLQHRCFPVNIAKFLRTTILRKTFVNLHRFCLQLSPQAFMFKEKSSEIFQNSGKEFLQKS